MKILMVSSEVAPYAKTGGMADAVGDLGRVLYKQGHDVRFAIPHYKSVSPHFEEVNVETIPCDVRIGSLHETAEWHWGQKSTDRCPVYSLKHQEYFERADLYGDLRGDYEDNALRFGFFCYAVLALLQKLDWTPDVIHCHDWQSGLIPLLLKTRSEDYPRLTNCKTVLTIHNLAYQGLFSKSFLARLGLNDVLWTSDGIEYFGKGSFLKAGLVFADALNTVSSRYAQEIQTPELGLGLDGVLRKRRHRLWGIVNGIDLDVWDPSHDLRLRENYDVDNIEGKSASKKELMELAGFKDPSLMCIAMVSRLVTQKGFDILVDSMHHLMSMNINLVVMGTGDPQLRHALQLMAQRYPQFKAFMFFDEGLSHPIFAGADAFLMPSAFEPCGLSQMIAMRYGTLPIVNHTGGLADTVDDWDATDCSGTGFVMKEYSPRELNKQVQKALTMYSESPDDWARMMRNAMKQNFSWTISAQKYESVYACILA